MKDNPFDERFWNDSAYWPDDTNGYVFLPRALPRLEGNLYPHPLQVPSKPSAEADEAETDTHEDAIEDYEQKIIERRAEVLRLFVRNCQNGTLICATRPKPGGHFTVLEPPFWNTERYLHWFRLCDISLENPYDSEDTETSSAVKQWLYVRSDKLAQFSNLEGVSERSSRYLSPYMSLMIEVIDELGVCPTKQPGVKELKAKFAGRWKALGRGTLSDRLQHAMATLVRDLGSQIGGNPRPKKDEGLNPFTHWLANV